MINIIPNIWQFLFLLLWMLITLPTAYVIVFNPKYRINQIEAFNIYPFICLKCTTFWTNLIPNILMAYIWNYNFIWWGIITASILAFMIWYSYRN